MKAALKGLVDRHPALKRVLKTMVGAGSSSVSTGYEKIEAGAVPVVGKDLEYAWQDASLPARQRKLVESQLAAYRAGVVVPVFDIFAQAVAGLELASGSSLLEVGCSSGYYSEVLAAKGIDIRYRGSDYSASFIDLARTCYPSIGFDVEDATRLSYGNAQFDVVVSGCCLLHILDYPTAIAETARVAGKYAIFHRTPVQHIAPTRHFTKLAYGIKTMEICFNEAELVDHFVRNGLCVIGITTIDALALDGDAFAVKTYVCRKAAS